MESRDTPPTGLTDAEKQIRAAKRSEILQQHGVASWADAPDSALREWDDFLRGRTGGRRARQG